MAITQEQLDSFHRFASEKVSNGSPEISLEDLVSEWRTASERNEINGRIRRGLAGIEAGHGRSADEVLKDLREGLDIPT